MPVKVRCSNCERVVNAPDRARGKAVKCPQCGQAIRVPAATKKVVAPPPSSSMLIANIDLDRLEDTESRICPKCGTEVSEEDVECPKCHVDLATGTLSAKKRAELSRRGPNPKLYYKEFFRDGIEFWKKNKKIAFRLGWFSALFTAVSIGCVMITIWAIKPLVRDFWLFCAVVAILIPPGLAWNLHTVIIDATLRKKTKLPKYNFDKFLGAALSLKLITWYLVVSLPLHLIAAVMLLMKLTLAAALVEGGAFVFAALLFPLATSHMAMPVTRRGWMLHKMSLPFFRTLPAVLYWNLFFYLVLLVPVGCIAGGVAMSAKDINQLVIDSNENSRIYVVKQEIEDLPKNKGLTPEQIAMQQAQPRTLHWGSIVVPALLCMAGSALFGLASPFLMRTNGLYTYYFLDSLDLESMAPEIVYVPKAKNLDELELKKKLSGTTVAGGLALAFLVGAALGASVASTFTSKGFLFGASAGMMAAGGLSAVFGLGWFVFAIVKEKKFGWSVVKFPTAVLIAGLIYGTVGVVLFSNSASEVARHENG